MGAAIYLEDNIFTAEHTPHTAKKNKKQTNKKNKQPKTKTSFFGN